MTKSSAKSTPPRDKLTARLSTDALLLAAALILSWLEAVLPLGLPLPGFRLGLANLAIVLAAQLCGRRDALIVMLARVTVSSLLFGSATAFLFSLCGGLASVAVVSAAKGLRDRGLLSLAGISVGSAAAHNLGQLAAACMLFGSLSPLGMLWWLLLLSVPTGLLTGVPAEIIVGRIRNKL